MELGDERRAGRCGGCDRGDGDGGEDGGGRRRDAECSAAGGGVVVPPPFTTPIVAAAGPTQVLVPSAPTVRDSDCPAGSVPASATPMSIAVRPFAGPPVAVNAPS